MRIEIELDSTEVSAGLVIRISQERQAPQVQTLGEDQDAGAAPKSAEAEAIDAGAAPQSTE